MHKKFMIKNNNRSYDGSPLPKINNQPNIDVKVSPPSLYKSLEDNKSRIIPFNILLEDVGGIRYFPPTTKEWKNSICTYNPNYMKNLALYDIHVNNLIKNYFNLSFTREFLYEKYIHIVARHKKKRFSLRKIYVSKAEVKHTNSKALINIFIYNKQKKSFIENTHISVCLYYILFIFKKYLLPPFYIKQMRLINKIQNKMKPIIWTKRKIIKYVRYIFNSIVLEHNHLFVLSDTDLKHIFIRVLKKTRIYRFLRWLIYKVKIVFKKKYSILKDVLKKYLLRYMFRIYIKYWIPFYKSGLLLNKYDYYYNEGASSKKKKFLLIISKKFKIFKRLIVRNLSKARKIVENWCYYFRKLKFKLHLNKFKFKYKLLYRLGIYLKKLYKKRIEFNIVNLKSRNFNIDILTSLLTMRISRRKKNLSPQAGLISYKLQKGVKFPRAHYLIKSGKYLRKNKDMSIIENNYKNLNINYMYLINSPIYKIRSDIDSINKNINSILPEEIVVKKKEVEKISKNIDILYNKKDNICSRPLFENNIFKFERYKSIEFINKKIKELLEVKKKLNEYITEREKKIKELLNIRVNLLRSLEEEFNVLKNIQPKKKEDIFNKYLLKFYKGINFKNKYDYSNIKNIIFEKIIKYKNIGGVKFEISGRLTRRYRADRAIFVRRIFGGLNNIDSSYGRKPSVILRGYMNCNVDSTIFVSKRRIGAFAVKGWMSGR